MGLEWRFMNHFLIAISKLRLNKFPRGLGKGHDAAVLGAWLAEEMQQLSMDRMELW